MWTNRLEPEPATRVVSVSALAALATATAVCALVAVLPPSPLRCACVLATSGVAPLLALRSRYSVGELLAFAPLASLLLWSLLGALGGGLASLALAFFPVLLAGILTTIELKRRRTVEVGIGALDAAAACVAALLAMPVRLVFAHNGALSGAPASFEARSWFARDTFYFASLAEMHVATGALPRENPFVAGAPNLYPSLLHCGVGELSRLGGVRVPVALDVIAPIVLLATVAALPLVVVRAVDDARRARGALVAGALTVAFVLIRIDLFVYPHTQSLVLGWLVLGAAFLLPDSRSPAPAVIGALILAAIPFAHTVTGAIAMVLVTACGVSVLRERSMRLLGAAFIVGAVAVLIVAQRAYALPFPSERLPSLPRGAFAAMAPFLAPWRAVLLAVSLICAASFRTPSRAVAPLLSLLMAVAYYAYGAMLVADGDRWFVHYNAERFIHYALFASAFSPALARPIVAGLAIALVMGGIYAFPPAITRASMSLAQDAPLVLGPAEMALYEAVRTRTSPRARIISDAATFALPAFTGRAQAALESGTLWSMGTLPAGRVATLANERRAFFTARPEVRLRTARLRGYTHALVAQPIAVDARAAYVARFLSDGSAQLIYASPTYLLLALNGARNGQPLGSRHR